MSTAFLTAGTVAPHELPAARAAGPEGDKPIGGRGERRQVEVGIGSDILGQSQLLADERATLDIETLSEQRVLPDEQEPVWRHECRGRVGFRESDGVGAVD